VGFDVTGNSAPELSVLMPKNHLITMRKITHIILLILSSATLTRAQTLIPKAGITISSLGADSGVTEGNGITSDIGYSSQNGFTIGLGYNLPVTTIGKVMFSVQPEFNYIQKGYKIAVNGEYYLNEAYYQVTSKTEYNLHYLEIPVLAKFEYGADKIKVALYTGPSLGFALGGKYKTHIASTDGGETVNTSYKGKIVFYDTHEENEVGLDHNIDFGLQSGAAITFLNRIVLDVRYGMSLTDITHDQKSKNRVLQFTVGVPISL
jgi:hypothetical protein